MDSSELAFRLRQEFDGVDEDDRLSEPEGYGVFGDFRLVGHGNVTNGNCGKFSSFYGCVRTELHDRVDILGEHHKGLGFVRRVAHSCNNPNCPTCFKYGWAVREAGCIEERLKAASEHFGAVEYVKVVGSSKKGLVLRGVEHIVASVPSKDYGLCDGHYERLRAKVVKILTSRGVAGGCLVFHAFRYDERDYWYFSPHFHVLGFIFGGFGRCRHCDNCGEDRRSFCRGCDGFYGRSMKLNVSDGYIVKVLDKRRTVGGTAWYELNHASVKVGVKLFHVATWFGTCSYRKLKVTAESRKGVCPICGHDLVKLIYHGDMDFVAKSPLEFFDFVCDKDGRAVWVVDERKRSFA